ncbi:MAG: fumarate hydratase, partial [bacterium]|nr:fumarate hydratase [bacterium]
MTDYHYEKTFQLGQDTTPYRCLTKDYVSTVQVEGRTILKVACEGLTYLAREAFRDVSFFLRPGHLEQVASILEDPEASENDRFVALTLIQNSVVAAKGQLPTCQDTGTAIVMAKKGESVWTDGDDEEALSKGVFRTYAKENLRYSQIAPLDMFKEKNTGNNCPAQIDIYSTKKDSYEFLFVAKGGGSANKTYLYQQTKSLLNESSLEDFLRDKIKSLGTAACPPYHLAVVIGGTSAESNLKVVKLACSGYLDHLPTTGNPSAGAFRDLEWEERVRVLAQESRIGAQFGG